MHSIEVVGILRQSVRPPLPRCLNLVWFFQEEEEEKMPAVWWTALKKRLNCKSAGSCDVIKRDAGGKGIIKRSFLSASLRRSGCSRSISNLRDVIHGGPGRRHQQRPPPAAAPSFCGSPRSIGSNDVVVGALTHDALLGAGTPGASGREHFRVVGTPGRAGGAGGGSPFPYSPLLTRCSTTPLAQRKSPRAMSPLRREGGGGGDGDGGAARASCEVGVGCRRCGGRFASSDALESHHLASHAGKRRRRRLFSSANSRKLLGSRILWLSTAVTELADGESSRKVVEIICKAGWAKPEDAMAAVERIVKVHNVERSVARFEEFREAVKGRAARLAKKHPRCIADGNELLRFHGATVSCSLGAGGSPGLCTSGRCDVCRIIAHGFSAARQVRDGVGVFTTSTSKRALECIQDAGGGGAAAAGGGVRHALVVCRVIAGRIHRPLENLQDAAAQPGFDSVAAGQVGAGAGASIEELYLLNPRALLPCFVVICKS
ncbi:hypothetical protein ACP4OV_013886 [Aristida adscensionis]